MAADRPVPMTSRLALFLTLVLLGHSFGVGYLSRKAQRAETGGMYLSALSRSDRYATIEWDEFVYYPRAIAVAQGWRPLDPWVSHEHPALTWGVLPPFGAVVFGSLTTLTGDLQLALYLATVISTVLIGWLVAGFLMGPPLRLSPWPAALSAIVFVKMPWLGVKAQELLPFGDFIQSTVRPFVLGAPLDALIDVEAGLFTYVPYTLFIVLFWRAVYDRSVRAFVATGLSAGLLVYVYFYHYIYAFALLAAWAVVAAVRRDRQGMRSGGIGLVVALVCTIPSFLNLSRLGRIVSVPEYVGRLGVEPAEFSAGHAIYLVSLTLPLLLAWLYARVRPGVHVPAALMILLAMVMAYLGVLNMRLVLPFDVQSDHYWRLSFGLPATMWVVVVGSDLIRFAASRTSRGRRSVSIAAGVLIGLVCFGIIKNTTFWLSKRWHIESPSASQMDMARRMTLLKSLARPGDVLMVTDIATAYHAMINAEVRPFVPFVQALVPESEILRRFFQAQYVTGSDRIRAPRGLDGVPAEEPFAATSEMKYLFGAFEAKPDAEALADMLAERTRLTAGRVDPLPRVDLVLVPVSQEALARSRIVQQFDIIEERFSDGFWCVRVKRRMDQMTGSDERNDG